MRQCKSQIDIAFTIDSDRFSLECRWVYHNFCRLFLYYRNMISQRRHYNCYRSWFSSLWSLSSVKLSLLLVDSTLLIWYMILGHISLIKFFCGSVVVSLMNDEIMLATYFGIFYIILNLQLRASIRIVSLRVNCPYLNFLERVIISVFRTGLSVLPHLICETRERLDVMESFNRVSFPRPSWTRKYSLSQDSMNHWQQQNLHRWRKE